MINLIPPSAKKSIVTEYWLRVLSVWCFTWAFALVVGIFLLVPVYVLINLQVSTLSESAALASEKLANLKDVTGEFNLANQQARVLIEGSKRQPLSVYNTLFRELETTEVSLASITITRATEGIAPVALTGEAANRQALASFRDSLLALPEVESVDLPIANLAKDRDIDFNLTVTMKLE